MRAPRKPKVTKMVKPKLKIPCYASELKKASEAPYGSGVEANATASVVPARSCDGQKQVSGRQDNTKRLEKQSEKVGGNGDDSVRIPPLVRKK